MSDLAAEAEMSGRGQAHHVIIQPTSLWRSIDLRELWRYRGLLGALTRRDITLRYRQTLLGPAWVVIQPLLAAGIFSFVFGSVAKLPSDGVPYFLFAFVGLIGYNTFSNTLNSVGLCLVGNSSLVGKVYFPRLILPISQIGSKLVDLFVTFLLYLVLLELYGVSVSWNLATFPLWVVLAFVLALGPGLLAAAANVSYRDVGYILPVLLPLLLYISPVAYSSQAVPQSVALLYSLNPLVGLIDGIRWSLLGTGTFSLGATVYSVVFACVLMGIGLFYFRSHERRFADDI
jgi:lipopolysaccharide transport system permease protein